MQLTHHRKNPAFHHLGSVGSQQEQDQCAKGNQEKQHDHHDILP